MLTIDLQRLPAHVAVIMDGNGRWAQRKCRPRTEGHNRGADAVRRVVQCCRRLGIKALTLYAFSEQNWIRPGVEVKALMELLRRYLIEEHDDILDKRIRLRAIGRLDRLPRSVRAVLDPLVACSASNRGMTLTLALSYGGQEEIADSVRCLLQQYQRGSLRLDQIDKGLLESFLPSMEQGPVDLLIRTGGEQRISNFVLWGAAYAELFFSETLWPDFHQDDLFAALSAYQRRERRFGAVVGPEDTIAAKMEEKGLSAMKAPSFRRRPSTTFALPPGPVGTSDESTQAAYTTNGLRSSVSIPRY